MKTDVTFGMLRAANVARLPLFRNKHGDIAHAKPDGSDWSPAQWLQAVVGELGEYANVRKKFERGDLTLEEFQREAADELADVVTYLDILALQLGINLGLATADKFNRVSKRVRCDVALDPEPIDGVRITGHQAARVIEFCGGELDTELWLERFKEGDVKDPDDSAPQPAGLYVSCYEYPEEGYQHIPDTPE